MDFPKEGVSYPAVKASLRKIKRESHMDDASLAKLLLGLYRLAGLSDIKRLAEETFVEFMESIPDAGTELGVRRMEREVISMMGSLWGSNDCTGFITTGGIESNMVALCTARDHAKVKRGSVVMPSTALPYFIKACYILSLEPISVPVKGDFSPDLQRMSDAVRKDTVAIIGTCGTNPWGTIDPIREIGEIAQEKSLYFHIDAAYGGLLCPWLKELGWDIPEFGFKVKSVSSISADPHKTGFSVYPGGSIVFRDEELARLARWELPTESYESLGAGMIGTRPGFSIAVTWALFNYLGREGYVRLSEMCMDATNSFQRGVEAIPELSVASEPKINIGHAVSTSIDLDPVKRILRAKGWFFWGHRGVPKTRENAIWICLYPYQAKIVTPFLRDLRQATAKVRSRD
jgi:tyrosine decarboxylase/aspartate 1-decarboxylase